MTQYTQTILTLLILTIINVDAKTTGYRPEYLINTTYTPTAYTSIEGQIGFITIKAFEVVNMTSVSVDNMVFTIEPKTDNLFIFIIYIYINLFIFIIIIINNFIDETIETIETIETDQNEIAACINATSNMIKRLKANNSASLIQSLFKGVYFRNNILPEIIEKDLKSKKVFISALNLYPY